MNTSGTEIWFAGRAPCPQPRLRLFCIPYAGAGASIYRSWIGAFGPDVDVCPVQLPGRETRHAEPLVISCDVLIPTLGGAIRPLLDVPFAIFGHSLGAVVAYELTRWLASRYRITPVRLFVSARRAPHVPDTLPPLHGLADDAFVAAVRQRYDGIPQAVLDCPELMELLLPRLRADFSLLEGWRYVPGPHLSTPLTVFGGDRDITVRRPHLEAWREHTDREFAMRVVPGSHLFLSTAAEQILTSVREDLAECAREGVPR